MLQSAQPWVLSSPTARGAAFTRGAPTTTPRRAYVASLSSGAFAGVSFFRVITYYGHMKRTEIFLLTAIILAALALRLYRIGYREFWFDELGQIVVAQSGWWNAVLNTAKHAGATPLDYLITRVMLQAGQGEAILRLPAAIWGVVAIVLVFCLARIASNGSPALTAAFLLAITPQHIRYSQELRFYSLATMMALLCVYAFWQAQKRNGWQGWTLWGCVLTAGLYAHYYLAFVGAACCLWALLYRRNLFWRATIATGAAALLFMPWVWYDNVIYAQTVFHPRLLPSWRQLIYAPLSNNDPLNLGLWALVVLTIATIRHQRPIIALFALVGLVAFAGAVALDSVAGYSFYQRQALIALPFLLLAGISGLLVLLPRWRWVISAVIVAACLASFVPDLQRFYPDSYPDNGLAATALFLQHNVQPADVVVVGGDPQRFRFYAPNLADQIPGIVWRDLDGSMAKLTASHDRLFLVAWNFTPAQQLTQWAKAHGAIDVTPWAHGETRIYIYTTSRSPH